MRTDLIFVLPHLFKLHKQRPDLNQLSDISQRFSKSKRSTVSALQTWLIGHFGLANQYSNFQNSAQLMLRGLDVLDRDYCLRMDPVMLTATHNGILCRGNRVLNLSSDEQESLQLLINQYLNDQSMHFKWLDKNCGCLLYDEPSTSKFTQLNDVIGQDISERLAKGEDAKKWHSLMNDFQMLLHNCDVNNKRAEQGIPQVTGFWIWGEQHFDVHVPLDNGLPEMNNKILFTDSYALKALLPSAKKLSLLPSTFLIDAIQHSSSQETCIYVSEFEDVYYQNDVEGYIKLCERWLDGWLEPAITALSRGELSSVSLIMGNEEHYTLKPTSKYCFWRKQSLQESNK